MTGPGHPAAPIPGRPACRVCGATLDPHQAARGRVCAAPACERRQVQEASREVFQRDWNDYVARQRRAAEQAAPQIARAVRKLDAQPSELAIGVVPHQSRPLVPLPEDRRLEFEAWLDEIVGIAFSEPLPEAASERREREEAPEHPLVAATCTACQGACCALGGLRKAFLVASDIQRFRRRHPEATPESVRVHFLGFLPEHSVEHACVYQSATGCTLDRADRTDICNRYHCNPQTHLLTRMREMQALKAVIVAQEGETAAVVGAFDMRTGLERLGSANGADEDIGPEQIAAARDAALAQIPAPLPELPPYLPSASPQCEFCGAEIDRHQAATTKICGAPACEAARRRRLARAVAANRRGQTHTAPGPHDGG